MTSTAAEAPDPRPAGGDEQHGPDSSLGRDDRGAGAPHEATATVGSDEPTAVAGGKPLIEVTEDLARQGRDGQFQAVEGGEIRCLTCHERFAAGDAPVVETTRLEGASDPADGAIVVPVRCPHCSTEGALIAHYGPEASAAEADLLTALARDARTERSPSTS